MNTGPNKPDHVFERDGRRYVCWMQSEGESPVGLAGPAHAHWNVQVDGHEYRLFDALSDDLSFVKVQDFEDRVHDWYEANALGIAAVATTRG